MAVGSVRRWMCALGEQACCMLEIQIFYAAACQCWYV